MEHLIAEDAPRVEAVYLISHTGLLIKEMIREETILDSDIFSSMLSAVENFVKDSLSTFSGTEKEGVLNTLGFEDYRIIIESGRTINLVALLSGKENEFLINDMKDISWKLDNKFGTLFEAWDGNEDRIEGIQTYLSPLILSGKYDSVKYRESDPKARRNLLFENVSMGLLRTAKEKPVLLCIEDLQWCDPSSLALIHHIGKNAMESKIMILGTYRPEDISAAAAETGLEHPLNDTIAALNREEFFKTLELSRLPLDCIPEILGSMFGEADISPEMDELIYKETKGNPLFIIELVKYLIEENLIIKQNNTWILSKRPEEMHIPPKIFNIISLRLNRLEKNFRNILDYASIVGESFGSRILKHALNVPRLDLLEQLRELEQKYRLIQSDQTKYEFTHGKIREVVYSEIPFELRMEYHSIIAGVIEKLNKDNLEDVLETLAYHYFRCKNQLKAWVYLTKAAERAKRHYSNKEALRFYSEALEIAVKSEKKLEIFNSIAEIYDIIGDYDNSLATFERSLKLHTEPERLADVNTKIGILYLKKGDYESAIKHCKAALKLIEKKGVKEEAAVYETLGHVYHRKGEFAKAKQNYQKSLDLMTKLNNTTGIAAGYKNLGMILLENREYSEALKQYNRSLKLYEELRDSSGIQLCLNDIANLYFQMGEFDKAFEFYDRSLKLTETTGDQANIGILLLNIGQSLLQIDRLDSALEHLNRSLKISTSNDIQILTACNCWVIAETYIKKGGLERALNFSEQALDIATRLNNQEIVAAIRRVFGIIYKIKQDWARAAENFNESVGIYRNIGNEKELGDTLFEFGLMWKEKGDNKMAKKQLKEAIDIFKRLKLDSHLKKVKPALKNL
jgi:tetratricopeptide (TPR) repeat protein/predicted regulator of Ras-like GTPase activity (Roadblock/LC7/MglB family)